MRVRCFSASFFASCVGRAACVLCLAAGGAAAAGDGAVDAADDAVAAAAATAGASAGADVVAGVDVGVLGLGPLRGGVRRGDTLYVVRERGGVAVVDVTDPARPQLRGALLDGRAVSRLLLDGDRLIALVVNEEAVTFSLAAPQLPAPTPLAWPPPSTAPVSSSAVSPSSSSSSSSSSSVPSASSSASSSVPSASSAASSSSAATATATAARGTVLEVHDGRVIFAGAGFARGQRVAVRAQRQVEKPDLVHGGTALVAADEVTAVVAVEDVNGDRAMAVLGRGDVAAAGDVVVVTDAPLSESLFLPRRAPYTWSAGFFARPFFGLDSGGFPVGVLVDAHVRYVAADLPLALRLELAPVGGAAFADEAHYPGAIAFIGSYVTDWFEIGLGGGVLVGADGPCSWPVAFDPATGAPKKQGLPSCEQNSGATVDQALRLGAEDGVHLRWRSSIFARDTGFVLGTGRAELGVPVSSRVSLFAGGGVGENGWALGEIGVRTFAYGTGGAGTVVVSASLGGAGVFDGAGVDVGDFVTASDVVAGPAVGFGMEWRP